MDTCNRFNAELQISDKIIADVATALAWGNTKEAKRVIRNANRGYIC